MELSIIVTNYKNPELLKECLKSIKKYSIGESCEIIVSDSETEEDTELMMKNDFPEIIFFSSRGNIGFARLVNIGLSAAKGEYILILNGDMIIKEGSIKKLWEFIRSHPEVGIVGPKLLNFNDTLQYSCSRFYKPITILYRRTFLKNFGFAKKHIDWFLMKDFDHKSEKEVDWIMGSALMSSRSAIKKIGLLDDGYKMYFEDVDWCRRFWENGYKVVYYPKAEMYHYHGRGSAGKSAIKSLLFNKLTWLHIRSAIKYFLKYWGKPLPQHG